MNEYGTSSQTAWSARRRSLAKIIQEHDEATKCTLSLIASCNTMSDSLVAVMKTDLANRVAEGKSEAGLFPGMRHFYEIETLAEAWVADCFDAEFAELRPLSGSQANMIVLAACGEVDDVVLTPRIRDGGHVSTSGRISRELRRHRFVSPRIVPRSFIPDVSEVISLIDKHNPKVVFLGGSVVIEAWPVQTIVEHAHNKGSVVVYDASHTAGLIATGVFPNPILEGVDLMTITTCKTIPGPSHGWILGKKEFQQRIERTVFPGFVSGGHLQEYIGAIYALCEVMDVAEQYATTVIGGANRLAKALSSAGFEIITTTKGAFTETHQVICEKYDGCSAKESSTKTGGYWHSI